MLAFFPVLQTGHESNTDSQCLQQQRCRQGNKITVEFLKLHPLQIIIIVLLCFVPCSETEHALFLAGVSSSSAQQDSASSEEFVAMFSLIWSNLLVNDIAMASFSSAILFQIWFSVSNFLRKISSSIVFFEAFTISSSFCLNKTSVFASIFFINVEICCFPCSLNAVLNLSF